MRKHQSLKAQALLRKVPRLSTLLFWISVKKKVYYIILLYSIAYCDIGIAVNRIDYVNCLNNGVSLCLFILGVIIIDIIYSGHFKRKK